MLGGDPGCGPQGQRASGPHAGGTRHGLPQGDVATKALGGLTERVTDGGKAMKAPRGVPGRLVIVSSAPDTSRRETTHYRGRDGADPARAG